MVMDKPDCYKCKHRRQLLGDCHSRCAHPNVERAAGDSLVQILSLLGAVGRSYPIEVDAGLNITGNEHGKRNGWFCWPFNFDPVWLEACDGWEEVE